MCVPKFYMFKEKYSKNYIILTIILIIPSAGNTASTVKVISTAENLLKFDIKFYEILHNYV